jgi:hypothetical protein
MRLTAMWFGVEFSKNYVTNIRVCKIRCKMLMRYHLLTVLLIPLSSQIIAGLRPTNPLSAFHSDSAEEGSKFPGPPAIRGGNGRTLVVYAGRAGIDGFVQRSLLWR